LKKRKRGLVDGMPKRRKRVHTIHRKGERPALRVRQIQRTVLTEKLIQEIVDLILEGMPHYMACRYLCICVNTMYSWKSRGESYINTLSNGSKPDPEDEIYALYVLLTEKAFAQWQLKLLRRSFRDKSSATWIRDMTMLERRDRTHWGRSERVEQASAPPLPDEAYM
jgi:hypothetical protein